MAVIPDAGLQLINDYVLGIETAFGPISCRLYVNNVTPGPLTVAGDLTECTASSYAAVEIDPADWTASFVSTILTYDHDAITYTFTSTGQTLYGFFLTDDESGTIIAAGKFLNPFVIPSGTSNYAVKPSWRDGACT